MFLYVVTASTYWTIILAPLPASALMYDNTAAGLDVFPSDIPPTVGGVDVSENLIGYISATDLTGYNLLTRFTASSNLLTEFPDVRPLGNNLTNLDLANNQISVVNRVYLTGVTKLQQLFLSGNMFSVFPDLGDSKPSLLWLYLDDNLIIEAPLDALLNFNSLYSFHLQGNMLDTIPNSCDASFWNRLVGHAWGLGNMNCDCRLLHAFNSVNVTTNIAFRQLWECQTPPSLVRLSFDSGLQLEDLTCNETFSQGRIMKLVKSDFYCHYPYVTKRVSVDSAKECAVLCTQSEGCYYFNIKESQGQSVICDLTSVLGGPEHAIDIESPAGWSYYSII